MPFTFNADVDLRFRCGSNVSQVDANQKLRDHLRAFVKGGRSGLVPPIPSEAEIDAMNTNQLRPLAQQLVRGRIQEARKNQRINDAHAQHVLPVISAPDETDAAP